MTFILPRWGGYDVSIIHINSSTIAISVVEPQDDADTFINSCGETGERPAIRVMITINDVWVTAQVNNDAVKNVNIEVYNMNKLQLDEYTHHQKVKVYNGLLEFAVDNNLAGVSFREVIRAVTRAANDADKSVVDYLTEFAIDDADIMDDGVIDDD